MLTKEQFDIAKADGQYAMFPDYAAYQASKGGQNNIYDSNKPFNIFNNSESANNYYTQFPSINGIGSTSKNPFIQQNADIYNPIPTSKTKVQEYISLDPLAEQQGTEIPMSENNPYSNQWLDTALQPEVPSVESKDDNKNSNIDNTNQKSFYDYLTQVPNLGMGITTDDKFKIFGMGLKYDSSYLNNDQLEKKANKANTLSTIAAGTAGLLSATKNIFQGIGFQNRQNNVNKDYFQNQRDLQKEDYRYENGGEINVYPDGGVVPLKSSKGGTFNDSLNLYNAYMFQKNNVNYKPAVEEMVNNLNKMGYSTTFETLNKERQKNMGTIGKINKIQKGRYDYNTFGLIGYDAMAKSTNDEKIYNYFKSLKFDDSVKIGKYSSPDIVHKTIKPIGEYFDGIAMNPVYKKPFQTDASEINIIQNTVKNEVKPYTPNYDTDLVAYLQKENKPFSFEDRKKLAVEAGITDYKGTAEQNIALLKYIQGKGEIPTNLKTSAKNIQTINTTQGVVTGDVQNNEIKGSRLVQVRDEIPNTTSVPQVNQPQTEEAKKEEPSVQNLKQLTPSAQKPPQPSAPITGLQIYDYTSRPANDGTNNYVYGIVYAGKSYTEAEFEALMADNPNAQWIVRKKKSTGTPSTRLKDGGEIPLFRDGGSLLDIPFEKMALDEYIGALPKSMEKMGNAEIEKDEYVIGTDNTVKKAVGDTHEDGGIKVVLQEGTKIVSDNLKIGKDVAEEFKKNYNLKVSPNTTYAEAVDKYSEMIGLNKENKELEDLYKQLQKNDEIQNKETKKINETFLQQEIAEHEKKRQPLLDKRLEFTNRVYNNQQASKEEQQIPIFKNGGIFKSDLFQTLLKKHNLTEEQGIAYMQMFEDGGQQMTQQQNSQELAQQIIQMYAEMIGMTEEQMQQQFLGMSEEQLAAQIEQMTQELQAAGMFKYGGEVRKYEDGNPKGRDAIKKVEENWKEKPDYSYNIESLPAMKERLLEASKEWNVTEYENRIKNAKTIAELDSVAADMQKNVTPAIAKDFGLKIAPTKKGLQSFSKEELAKIISDPTLLKKVEAAKSGSFKSLTEDERYRLSVAIQEANSKGILPSGYAEANFKDSEWFFRYPSVKKVEFDNQEEYDKYLAEQKDNMIDGKYVASNKKGLYIEPVLTLTEATPSTTTQTEAENKITTYATDPLVIPQAPQDNGMLFVPATPNLPPDGVFPHLKREFRTELIDPFAISPEAVLRENYRAQDASAINIDNLPIGMRGAANANLTALTQQQNAVAIMEAERFNAQNRQNTEQMNVQLNNQDEVFRYNEVPRYEEMQLRALENTKNDLFNYFNTGITNELNRYQYKNNANMIQSMFPEVTVDEFGVPRIKKDVKIDLG